MSISNNLIDGVPQSESILIPGGGFLDIKISYTAPFRERNAVMSLLYRVTSNRTRTALQADITGAGATPPTNTMPIVSLRNLSGSSVNAGEVEQGVYLTQSAVSSVTEADILITPAVLGEALKSNLITPIVSIQSSEVVYRRVDVKVCNAIAPEAQAAGSAAARTADAFVSEKLNGNLKVNNVYRYKCGSALTGTYKGEKQISRGSLAFLLYGAANSNEMDKPSRFLFAGTTFKSYSEAIADPNVETIVAALSKPITFGKGTAIVRLTPAVEIQNSYRQVQLVQLEGISRVAGMAKRNEAQLKGR